jgi:hypothetical protein
LSAVWSAATFTRCTPEARLVERFFHSGDGLTNANTGLPETNRSRWSVSGVAPAGRTRRVTTPLTLDVLDELEEPDAEELVPEAVLDAEEPLAALEPPEPPDGAVVADCEGEGNGVFVFVGLGDGDGVTVAVGDVEGEGEGDAEAVGEDDGLPESPEASGSAALACTVATGALRASAAYVCATAPAATFDVDCKLEVVVLSVDELLLEDELVEESLAAPPPKATEVVPLAELSEKSAETVCEIVPLVTFAVM